MEKDIRKKVLDEVTKTIQQNKMLAGVKRLVIAFSAGPDSVCLLDTLHSLYGQKIDFHLAYVNHGLRRPKVLKTEEALTRKYAAQYQAKYQILQTKIKKGKTGIEASARDARYHALLNYQKKIKAQAIALGHNLDDVVETFFMNLMRGSGMMGLTSIPMVRPPFIRPLINVTKRDILSYLALRRLPYASDKTNICLDYRRNLMRNKIIPQFLKIYPQLHAVIKRGIEILRQDDAYLEKVAENAYRKIVTRQKNLLALDIKKILRYNPSIRSRTVIKAIKEIRGDVTGYESKHFEALLNLKDRKSGRKIDLPKGLYGQRAYDKIIIGYRFQPKPIKIVVKCEDVLWFPDKSLIETHLVSDFNLNKKPADCEVFDYDTLEPPLFVKSRESGDYIETKIGRKKIKKVLAEFKVPIHERHETMMLCDQKGVLWILGLLRARRGFINKKTKKLLVVKFEHSN